MAMLCVLDTQGTSRYEPTLAYIAGTLSQGRVVGFLFALAFGVIMVICDSFEMSSALVFFV